MAIVGRFGAFFRGLLAPGGRRSFLLPDQATGDDERAVEVEAEHRAGSGLVLVAPFAEALGAPLVFLFKPIEFCARGLIFLSFELRDQSIVPLGGGLELLPFFLGQAELSW